MFEPALPNCLPAPESGRAGGESLCFHPLACGVLASYRSGAPVPAAATDGMLWILCLRGHAQVQHGAGAMRVEAGAAMLLRVRGQSPQVDAPVCAQHLAFWCPAARLSEPLASRLTSMHESVAACAVPRVLRIEADTLRVAAELVVALQTPDGCALLREAKGLELLSRLLASETSGAGPRLTIRQQQCIRHAHALLLRDLANPPTVAELARACGLNTCTLKQGFRRVYGHSIHALFQQQRMQHAWQLLESGALEVGTVGHRLGYSNLSHFAAAFRRCHGVLPGQLKHCAVTAKD